MLFRELPLSINCPSPTACRQTITAPGQSTISWSLDCPLTRRLRTAVEHDLVPTPFVRGLGRILWRMFCSPQVKDGRFCITKTIVSSQGATITTDNGSTLSSKAYPLWTAETFQSLHLTMDLLLLKWRRGTEGFWSRMSRHPRWG